MRSEALEGKEIKGKNEAEDEFVQTNVTSVSSPSLHVCVSQGHDKQEAFLHAPLAIHKDTSDKLHKASVRRV